MREAVYQAGLVQRIQEWFPGCYVLRNNPLDVQGLPDLLVLYGTQWAMLEAKASRRAKVQPNQAYYSDMFNGMSFSAFICPENEEEVLHGLQSAFGAVR